MGHAIGYITYDVSKSKKYILEDLNGFAYNPYESSGYHGNLTFHDVICENRDEAEKFIERHDRGWYSDHAVKFKDCGSVAHTKAMDKKLESIKSTRLAKNEYEKKNKITNRKSEFIGCKNCGSKLNLSHMRSNSCPLCGNDLRSDTIRNKLKEFDVKIKKLNEEYKELENKLSNKANTKWLVKYEYHC